MIKRKRGWWNGEFLELHWIVPDYSYWRRPCGLWFWEV